ncbi:MAG: SPOR domain-containing protein [Rhodobacterales bacterium]|nr:SPOR domain-containing protein [Rhodobacterales bacterium]
MAEIPFDGRMSAQPKDAQQSNLFANGRAKVGAAKASAGTVANWAGAAVSIGLVIGIGIWGYKLLARDVSGVPVVRAAQGPMRIQPEDRGGSQADNQGLAVNSVAAEGMAEAPADRLVLAPRPVQLNDADQPFPVLASLSNQDTEAAVAQETEQGDAPQAVATPQMASIQALAEQLATGASTLGAQSENTYVSQSQSAETGAATVEIAAVAVPELAKGTQSAPSAQVLGGLQRSLRPQLRPASLRTNVVAVAPTNGGTVIAEIDPETIPAGTRLVQLGAFDSAEVAKSEWAKLDARFGTYLEGKSRVIQRAQSGGRTFYRLRAMGFEDIASARRFCSALAAERADCIPVVTR